MLGFNSVQFGHSVMSDSLQPHESQHARPPCPSLTPGVYLNWCPSSQWCHPAISSSVVPFSSCPQSLPASGSFPMSQLFAWGGQSTGVSVSASVLPMNTQDWSPLGWTGGISLQSKGLSRVFSNTIVQKHQFFSTQLSSQSNSHIHTWPLEKPCLSFSKWSELCRNLNSQMPVKNHSCKQIFLRTVVLDLLLTLFCIKAQREISLKRSRIWASKLNRAKQTPRVSSVHLLRSPEINKLQSRQRAETTAGGRSRKQRSQIKWMEGHLVQEE